MLTSLFWLVAHWNRNAKTLQQWFHKSTMAGLKPALAFPLHADLASAGQRSTSEGQPCMMLLTSS